MSELVILRAVDGHIVTMTKAVGIVLMVLAHTLTYGSVLWSVIYTFHMPLFFIMSGYCFKERYLTEAMQFVIRKIKGIYIPFVTFSLVYLAMHNVFCSWRFYEPDWIYGWKDFAWNAGRIVTRMSHNEGLLGTFWFLKELFWGNLIFYAALRLLKGKVIPVVVGLLMLAEVLCWTHFRIPYFNVIHTSVLAAFFIAVGFLWRSNNERISEIELGRKWWMWLCGVTLIMGELIIFHTQDFRNLTATTMPVYVLPASAGTMMVFGVCRLALSYIKGVWLTLWEFIGNHTLSIMALHFTAFKLVSLMYIKVYDLPMERLIEFPVIREVANMWGVLLYLFAGIFIPLACAYFWLISTIWIKERIHK